jgi:hypothetical protein
MTERAEAAPTSSLTGRANSRAFGAQRAEQHCVNRGGRPLHHEPPASDACGQQRSICPAVLGEDPGVPGRCETGQRARRRSSQGVVR